MRGDLEVIDLQEAILESSNPKEATKSEGKVYNPKLHLINMFISHPNNLKNRLSQFWYTIKTVCLHISLLAYSEA